MNYKDTLLLPDTTFPMRGNLPQNEPKTYKAWDDQKLYQKMLDNRKNATSTFTLHDGPPYANGNIHIGHALNKILKDIITKYHYFQGKKIAYTPGWDCHGLPIEQQVEKAIGTAKKNELSANELRELCRKHAHKFQSTQADAFKLLGIMGDFDDPYLTMDNHFEANIYRVLTKVIKAGLLVQRSKPVNWSWAARSALAEAEIEYEDKESDSIYVAFDLSPEALKALQLTEGKMVIWTTTPWTLPANQGIALAREEEYIIDDNGYITAKVLHAKLVEKGVLTGKIAQTIDITKLEKLNAINPLNNRPSLIMFGDHVTTTDGTGCVHTAPGHGEDDYRVCLQYGIEVIMPVDERGCFDANITQKGLIKDGEEFVGMHIFKSHELIFERLGTALLKHEKIRHSYPHCWRTHKPTIFRATKQWFIALDKPYLDGKTLREVALEQIEATTFYPASGKNRLKSMIENRPDWCISRQRKWGVPIALLVDKVTKEPLVDEALLEHIASKFDKQGADAWYELSIEELLPQGSTIDPSTVEKTTDILDVWFDSGSTHFAVLQSGAYASGEYPADMYLEGSDQHRGWFQSSLLLSCAINAKAPYKSILTHGFSVDEKGNKMSKSKGNVIDPLKVANEMGAEVIRLWVALSDYQSDQKISPSILKQVSEQYRKTRNTLRFLLANTNDLETTLPINELALIDRWILAKAHEVFTQVRAAFEDYNFVLGLGKLNNFLVVYLSGIYLDVCKDKLYCDSKNAHSRQSASSAMAMIAKEIISILAPILTYTIDEVITHSSAVIKEGCQSVFDWEDYSIAKVSNVDINEDFLLKAREAFFEKVDSLKKEKIIKSTLELVLTQKSEALDNLEHRLIEDIFMVSAVEASNCEVLVSIEVEGQVLNFAKSNHHKCPRCWKFTATKEEALCTRCEEVMKTL